MKRGTISHPKMVELQARLDIPAYAAVGIMESLWHWTALYCPQGDLGRYSDRIIAHAVGWPEGDAEGFVQALVDVRWLDAHDEHRLVVHDWHDHADDFVHMSLARKGLRFATGEIPKLSRLSKAEREAISTTYGIKKSVRTKIAQKAHKKRTANANANANANALASCKRSNHKATGGECEGGSQPEAVGNVALRCIADFKPVEDGETNQGDDGNGADDLGMYRALISQATGNAFRWRGSHLLRLEKIIAHPRGPTLLRERVIDPLENSESEEIEDPAAFANYAMSEAAKELGVSA